MSKLDIRLLDGVGAEITGVDLAHLDDETFATVQAAFNQHGLVCFRDQSLSEREHIALAERFGRINVNRFFAAHPEYPQIAMVAKEPHQKENIGGGWHTDHSYDHEPALGSILVAREVPPSGGDTLFANMYSAYDALSPGLQQTLEGLYAVHSAKHIFGGGNAAPLQNDEFGGRIGNADATVELVDPIHPVIIRHPLSGRKALYINPAFTLHFHGWTAEESRPLLAYLCEVATRESHVQRFQWRPGSVAFWDNRATWHYALNDYQGQRRIMHRITIEGCALSPALRDASAAA